MTARSIAYWTALVVAVSCVAVGIVLTFTHPDMTRTRLFVTYWPVFAVEVAAVAVALLCLPDRGRRR